MPLVPHSHFSTRSVSPCRILVCQGQVELNMAQPYEVQPEGHITWQIISSRLWLHPIMTEIRAQPLSDLTPMKLHGSCISFGGSVLLGPPESHLVPDLLLREWSFSSEASSSWSSQAICNATHEHIRYGTFPILDGYSFSEMADFSNFISFTITLFNFKPLYLFLWDYSTAVGADEP